MSNHHVANLEAKTCFWILNWWVHTVQWKLNLCNAFKVKHTRQQMFKERIIACLLQDKLQKEPPGLTSYLA